MLCFILIYFCTRLVPNRLLFSDSQFGKYNKYCGNTKVDFLEGIFMDVMTKFFCNDTSNKCFTRAYSAYLKEISKVPKDLILSSDDSFLF